MEETADKTLKPIIFKTSVGFVYYDYIDIIMCSSDGNCTNVFSIGSDMPVRILHKISFVQRKYCNDKFLRCHKSHIINLMHLEKLLTKTHQAHLKRNFIVPLSNSCWRKIRQMSEINIHEI
jgi:DNA-binding LytR/AlgR family response regulator